MRDNILLITSLLTASIQAGLPGLMAQDYRKGDLLRIMVSNVGSPNSEKHFDYYEMGHMRPDPAELAQLEGLTRRYGQALAGEYWQDSPFTVWLNPSDKPHCLVVADDVPYDAEVADRLRIAAA